MKKKKKFKQQDEFGVSDYELYSYAVSRYKEATGDKSLSITGIIVYLEKEIRYYRKKIMSYDELRKKSAEKTEYKLDVADDIIELHHKKNSELFQNAQYTKMHPAEYATKAHMLYQEMFVMLKGAMIVFNYLNYEKRFGVWTATTNVMFNNCCDNIRKYRKWWDNNDKTAD